MIRTLAWKEYREHRSIWVALTGLTTLLVVSIYLFQEPRIVTPDSNKQRVLLLVAYVMAATYGLVCGSMMLAAEREGRTLTLLDALTGRRSPVWLTKLTVGVALVAGNVLWIAALGVVLRIPVTLAVVETGQQAGPRAIVVLLETPATSLELPVWEQGLVWVVTAASAGFIAYAWGLFLSALCRSVLTAAVLGVLAVGSLTGTVYALTVRQGLGFLTCQVLLAMVALEGSWAVFCRPDWTRSSPWLGFKQLLWLTWRQGWVAGLALVLIVALLVVPPVPPPWPLATWTVGVVCGTMVFAPEQAAGSFGVLGNQRLPLGRVWVVKTAFWAVVAAGVAGLVFAITLPIEGSSWEAFRLTRSRVQAQSIDLALATMAGAGVYLSVWLVTGFSVAQFCMLAVRNSAAAVVIAIVVSGAVLLLWVPSSIMGGLKAWQLYVVPVLLLVGSRLAMWPWASNRLGSRKPALLLIGCAVLSAAWIGATLWYCL
jgi:hypothetical protein